MTNELKAAFAISVGLHAGLLVGVPFTDRVAFDVERAPTSVEIVLVAPAKPSVVVAPEPRPPAESIEPQQVPTPPEPSPATIVTPEQKGALTEVLPNYLRNPSPVYPRAARERGEQGTVLLDVEVLSSGSCGQARILHSSGYEILDDAARHTIATWRFRPARRAGVPVTVWVEIPVTFRLEEAN